MTVFKIVLVVLIALAGVVSAYEIGKRLEGEGVWRFIGVVACLNYTVRAPSIVEGLFGA